MNRITLFSDSTCDLSAKTLRKYDIHIIPLSVEFGEASYKDGIDLNSEQLYDKVKELGCLPKTAAPSPSDFYKAFEEELDAGKDVIYIGLSSTISSTVQNAMLAARELDESRIHIIDSKNLCSAIGLLAISAAGYIKKGMTAEETAELVRQEVPKVQSYFMVDTLEYLHMGGRCTSIQNLIGGMLKMKPIIKVEEGRLNVIHKARGMHKGIDYLVNRIQDDKARILPDRMILTESSALESIEHMENRLKNAEASKQHWLEKAGCVISSHCGPGTIGVFYITE